MQALQVPDGGRPGDCRKSRATSSPGSGRVHCLTLPPAWLPLALWQLEPGPGAAWEEPKLEADRRGLAGLPDQVPQGPGNPASASLAGPSLAWGLLLGLLLAGTTRSRGAAGVGHCQCQWDRSLESRGVVAIEALR